MRYLTLLFIPLFVAWSCEETDGDDECPDNASCIPTETMMQEELDSLRNNILSLVNASECSESASCTLKGFGSKPCGGPWEYLIYSTSIDTTQLNNLVDQYNQLEDQLNTVYERGSDCSIAQAPDSVACGSSGCIAYWNEQVYDEGVCCN